jgi:hypothetical protein
LSGSSSICLVFTTPLTLVLVGLTSGASPVTVTVSCTVDGDI